MKTIKCPFCDHGKQVMLFPVPMKAHGTIIDCPACYGMGRIDARYHKWKKIGEKMKDDRIARGLTLRDECRRRNISPSVLSRMERGLDEPILA